MQVAPLTVMEEEERKIIREHEALLSRHTVFCVIAPLYSPCKNLGEYILAFFVYSNHFLQQVGEGAGETVNVLKVAI